MLQVVSDLHLHSKYSRAVSQNMTLPVMAKFGADKGLDLLTTGDWTHPLWFREIKSQLIESEEGIFKLKDKGLATNDEKKEVRFLLSVEISSIYTQNGKGRRIHNLVFAPSLQTAEKINKTFVQRGYNISSDGRPIIGLSSKDLLALIMEIDEQCLLIPCHVWTPWFGLYGASSGFVSIEESFGNLGKYIYGIETGLSSDPEMNWQIKELDTRSILSFSDAHSPAKMGREATVFELESLSYENIRKAIIGQSERQASSVKRIDSKNKVLYTIEFYPEEGKYHYSGHRNCNVTMTPEEQRATKGICPVCKRHVTDGVMRRVQELSGEDPRAKTKLNDKKLKWYVDPRGIHPPFVKIVPLLEIIAEAVDTQVGSLKVRDLFEKLIAEAGSELDILLKIPISEIAKIGGEKVAEGVQKVREGNIIIKPGYDGVYGVVKIWHEHLTSAEKKEGSEESQSPKSQLGMEF